MSSRIRRASSSSRKCRRWKVEVDVKAERLADTVFEILVTGTVTAKVSDKVAFLIEAKQAGIFDIRNIPAEQIDPLSHCLPDHPVSATCARTIADAITPRGLSADPSRRNQLPGALRAASCATRRAGRQPAKQFHPLRGVACAAGHEDRRSRRWRVGHRARRPSGPPRHDTVLWARDAALVGVLARTGQNARYLEGVPLPADASP